MRDKLLRVAGLAAGNELERDLALRMLQEIYSEIKFGKLEPGEVVVEEEECFEPEPVEEKPEPESESELLPEPEPAPVFEEVAEIVVEAPVQEERPVMPRPVAPEVIRSLYGEPRQTLGDSLRGGEKDTAAKLAAAEHPGLRKSIGLNDRFLMIRDMFDGNAAEFDRAIERLDAFTDLDEAIIHIHDTYDWSADNEGVKLLVELLERKLG